MKYILELKDFSNTDDINSICKRIEDTGYLSKSMSKRLEDLTGVVDIESEIYEKVDELKEFFNKFDRHHFEDILLELFDDSDYTYSIEIGFYIGKHYSSFYSRDADNPYFIMRDYYKYSDKERYLVTSLVKFIGKITSESYNKSLKNREERMKKGDWIQNPRSRGISFSNYFKYFNTVKPMITIYIQHKKYADYYANYMDDADMCLSMNGWSQEEYDANWKSGTVTSKIKSIISRRVAPCDILSKYFTSSYTSRELYINDNETIKNPKPILMSGILDVNFT